MSKRKPVKMKDVTMSDVVYELRKPDALLPMPTRKALERNVILLAHGMNHEMQCKWDNKMMLKRCHKEVKHLRKEAARRTELHVKTIEELNTGHDKQVDALEAIIKELRKAMKKAKVKDPTKGQMPKASDSEG